MTAERTTGSAAGRVECWCCGQRPTRELSVQLGNHPEVTLCLRCADFVHRQANARRDALRRGLAARARDVVRGAREQVIRRSWHHKTAVGPLLRWLGRHLP